MLLVKTQPLDLYVMYGSCISSSTKLSYEGIPSSHVWDLDD